MDYRSFKEAAKAYAEGFRPGAPLTGDDDCNPCSTLVNGRRYTVCGPTTGTYLSANNLEVVHVEKSPIGAIEFSVTGPLEE